jgi:hypothetical protein
VVAVEVAVAVAVDIELEVAVASFLTQHNPLTKWRRVGSNHLPVDYEVATLVMLHMCRKP